MKNHVTEEHIQAVGRILGQAFFDDPFYSYVMPNPRKRPAQLTWWMSVMVRYGYRYGVVDTTPGTLKGAAVWLPPEAPKPDTFKMLRAGLIKTPFQLGAVGFLRTMQITGQWEKLHEKEPDRHWYLMVAGIEPSCQGQGLGSSLLQPVLERADKESMTCYLETMTTLNLRFYHKLGFEIVAEGRLKNDAPYWAMRRHLEGTMNSSATNEIGRK